MMDFYNQKHVRARKSHKCEFCGKEIIPGEAEAETEETAQKLQEI